MAAAQATAQATTADMESHDQFAKDLRSYRSQLPQGGPNSPSKPAWDSEPATGAGLFDEGYSPGKHWCIVCIVRCHTTAQAAYESGSGIIS